MNTILGLCLCVVLHTPCCFSPAGQHPYASKDPIVQPKPFPIPEKSAWHITFTPDGNTFYFVTGGSDTEIVKFSHFKDGQWTTPELAPFSGKYRIETPSISPDGSKFFFTFATSGKENIYVMDRTASGWSEPRDLGDRVNTGSFDGGPSSAANGNLYFFSNRDGNFRIYRAKWLGTEYAAAEKLTSVFDTYETGELCVAPDEGFLLFNVHQADNTYHLCVSLRKDDDTWTAPRDLGPQVNFGSYQGRPCLSPDGKYLFFTASNTKDWITSQYQVDLASVGL